VLVVILVVVAVMIAEENVLLALLTIALDGAVVLVEVIVLADALEVVLDVLEVVQAHVLDVLVLVLELALVDVLEVVPMLVRTTAVQDVILDVLALKLLIYIIPYLSD
jgi:hypothetical protein